MKPAYRVAFKSSVSMPVMCSTAEKIVKFARLKAGWKYGEGEPFSNAVLYRAIALSFEALRAGFPVTDAFPGKNGNVSVTVYDGDDYYEFCVNKDSISFTHEREGELVHEVAALSLESASEIICNLRASAWNSRNTFFSFTSPTTTHILEDSDQLALRTHLTAESRWSTESAQSDDPDASVSMQPYFIQTAQPVRQSFGNFGQRRYLVTAH